MDPVQQLYLRLAHTLRTSRHDAFTAPVTVAEIYQELVPYRLVRAETGFDMNADYEHALLRLLAGEGECVRLEPPSAREAISAELRSPNPNVGLYRDFAGCDVWVVEPAPSAAKSTFALVEEDMEDASASVGSPPEWQDALLDDGPDIVFEDEAVFEEPDGAGADAGEGERGPSANCLFCESPLPRHRSVRFCPFCGADQATRPCGSCGEPVEPGWLFCVGCGARPDT
jgi:hypothetical protein